MTGPTLLWFRRDFRLCDHPALCAALKRGQSVIPIFIYDDIAQNLGAAPAWRLEQAIDHFAKTLNGLGSRLILRKGAALETLQTLQHETKAGAIYWSRAYDPESQARDTQIKAHFKAQGIEAKSFKGHLLFEPWVPKTKTGGYFKVYSPLWRAVKDMDVGALLSPPAHIPAPEHWPACDVLSSWNMGRRMQRGAAVVAEHTLIGAQKAEDRLHQFAAEELHDYAKGRNFPARCVTSRLSENLSVGEISPRMCWHIGQRALAQGNPGAETYLKELVWREFAYHLLHHFPTLATQNWRSGWDAFPWSEGESSDLAILWKQGRTGYPFVDAAMREMYVTGKMHNRARMIVASVLTKHFMIHWRVGLKWFEQCLTDWDIASNAMGWQWVAGCGPDAAPYFRVFNPETQIDKFDEKRTYINRWLAEGKGAQHPHKDALRYFEAIPKAWGLSAQDTYPEPLISVQEGRARALKAYQEREF